jgi:hypothetical protein
MPWNSFLENEKHTVLLLYYPFFHKGFQMNMVLFGRLMVNREAVHYSVRNSDHLSNAEDGLDELSLNCESIKKTEK